MHFNNGTTFTSANNTNEPKYTLCEFMAMLGIYDSNMVDLSLNQLLTFANTDHYWLWNQSTGLISVYRKRIDGGMGQLMGRAMGSLYQLHCNQQRDESIPINPIQSGYNALTGFGSSTPTTPDRSPSPDFITFTTTPPSKPNSEPEYIIIKDDTDDESMDTDEDLANSATQLLNIRDR